MGCELLIREVAVLSGSWRQMHTAFYPGLMCVRSLPSETRERQHAAGTCQRLKPTAAERPSADANTVRQRAERAGEQATADSEVAREEFETAKRDVQLAKTEIESLNAERARLKAAVERLESDKIAAENKAEVMKSVAYGTFVIALIAIVSSLSFRNSEEINRTQVDWT